jgi:hypothetical protein
MTKITHPQGTPIIAHSIVRYQARGFDTRVQIDELPEGSPYIGLDNISDAIAAAHAYISNT